MADFANLVIGVNTSQLKSGERDLKNFGDQGARTGSAVTRMGGAAKVALAGVVVALGSLVAASASLGKFVNATIESEAAQAQLASAILSTGGAAGRTAEQLNMHAAALQKVTNFGDESTNAMQGLLLTFTNIQGGVFDKATEAVLDVATAMGTDLQSAALQVGKALNDPVLGMTALSRSGIQFSQSQKDTVKEMVKLNDTAGAQAIILAELEKQFGGSAEAARATLGGALSALGNAFGDLFEISGEGSSALRLSIESLIVTISDPRFAAAFQALGAGLFGVAEIGIKAISGIVNAFQLFSDNIEIAAVAVIGLAATQIPAAVAAFAIYAGGLSLAGLGTAAFTLATNAARIALIAFGGPLGIVYGLLGAAAAAFFLFRDNAGDMTTSAYDAEAGSLALAKALNEVTAAEPGSSAAVIALANNNVKLADSAYEAAKAEVAKRRAMLNEAESVVGGGRSRRGTILGSQRLLSNANRDLIATETALAKAMSERNNASEEIAMTVPVLVSGTNAMTDSSVAAEAASAELAKNFDKMGGSASGAAAGVDKLPPALEAAEDATQSYSDTMQGFIVDGIGKAVDNMVDGFTGGLKSIKDIFVNTIKQMIAFAIKNKIMLSMGMGGSAMGTAASAATGGGAGAIGGALGGIGALGSVFMNGLSGTASAFMSGGIGAGIGQISATLGAVSGSLSSLAAAAGAVALPVLAVVGLFKFFSKSTKLLDEGLKLTVKGFDAAIQTFSKTKTSRFFGLSSKTSTSTSALSAAQASPITKSIDAIQNSVLKAADALGIGAGKFKKFSFDFTLSLKGLTEEQKLAAVSAELLKMGDSFASVIPGIKSFNQLLAVASERFNLQNRVLQIKGKGEELLARQREAELQATDRLNRKILRRIFRLEDAAIAEQKAADALAEIAAKNKAIFNERFAIETQLLQLQGNTGALRQRELAALDPANRALQQRIFALQDAAIAEEAAAQAQAKAAQLASELAAKAAQVASERFSIETQLLQLQGNTNELRRRELAALDPSNRALQRLIFNLEDSAKAAEVLADRQAKAAEVSAERQAKAAELLSQRQAKAEQVANERFGIETQLLQLQGNTARLRQRELAALDPANRALQRLIFSLEDTARAAEVSAERQARAAELLAERQARAADVARERFGLVNRVLELQGRDSQLLARIRADELSAADASNRAILRNIFALEDQAAASEKAADATQRAADAAKALFDAVDESNFTTGVDFRRGLSRASNGIEYTPQQSQAEMLMELKALNARIDMLQSTSEITANSSTQTADNTDFRNSLLLGV